MIKREDILKMEAGRELDALIGQHIMAEESFLIGVSNDNGKSWTAWVDPSHGPWYNESDLRIWLDEKHKNGLLSTYEIVRKKKYARYSTDISYAWEVVEKFFGQGTQNLRIGAKGNQFQFTCYFNGHKGEALADTALLAICRAALLAVSKGKEV